MLVVVPLPLPPPLPLPLLLLLLAWPGLDWHTRTPTDDLAPQNKRRKATSADGDGAKLGGLVGKTLLLILVLKGRGCRCEANAVLGLVEPGSRDKTNVLSLVGDDDDDNNNNIAETSQSYAQAR